MLRNPADRLRLIIALWVLALLPVLGQLVRLQVLEHPRYKAEAQSLVRRQYALPSPPWGVITDRNGDLLVGNSPVYDVGAEVNLVSDPALAAATLAHILSEPPDKLLSALTPLTDTQQWAWHPLAKHITEEQAARIRELQWNWLTLTPTWERYYAEGKLASHVIGFVNEQGMGYGVQAAQLRFLRGETITRYGNVSGDTSPMPEELVERHALPHPGTNLRLTLDRTVQAFVEGELATAIQQYHATGGTILVLDPRSGAILASASYPNYAPAQYAQYAAKDQASLFLDPAVSIAYEPGSVFKVVTVAAALDSGRATLDWSYYDSGAIEYGGILIHNWDGNAYGHQDLEGILAYSLNVGVATLSTRVLGPDIFYHYVRAFGFGQTTDIELADEAAGTVHLPTDWDWADSYLATNAFGQGIAVTPLQMATAVTAIANGGVMMQPHIVAERQYPDGRTVRIPPRPLGQPISAATALTMTELMARAVEREVPQAEVPGYRIAGKTGTAQIPTSGGYDPRDVIASFVGFGPLPNPQVLIFVKLDRPDVPPDMRWGSQTAAPLFRQVAERLFVLLKIPPTMARVEN